MPLPDPGTQGKIDWPPKPLAAITPKLAEWSAWYGGDRDQLARQYGGFNHPVGLRAGRPGQYAGGVVGAVSRMFWGQPAAPGQQLVKIHIPTAADIATASADLLFSEAPRITLPQGAEGGQERLEQILTGNLWEALLLEQGELGAALGGVYLRAGWDLEVEPGHPLADAVHADSAWPEFTRGGRLAAVTFWQVVGVDGQKWIRLLERHDPGRIEYGVYEGTRDQLGRRIPFGADTGTQGLAGVVDAESSQETGTDLLTVVYVPNMRPSRLWRADPIGAYLGRSDLDQVEPLMDAADEAMTSWMRDIRLGKARVIVPRYMLEGGRAGRPAAFNLDQEVFTALELPPSDEPGGSSREITTYQPEIRHEAHAATVKGILASIFRTAGYSAQTFGLPDEAMATATEVRSRDSRSQTTRERKTRYQGPALARFVRVLAELDTLIFRGGLPRQVLPDVTFPPSSRPSDSEEATSVQMWRAAQALSIDSAVRRANPDRADDEEWIAAEVAKITAEQSASSSPMPDPFALPVDAEGDEPAAPAGMSAKELAEASEALGRLVRAGVDPADAAERVGLAGVRFAAPRV